MGEIHDGKGQRQREGGKRSQKVYNKLIQQGEILLKVESFSGWQKIMVGGKS